MNSNTNKLKYHIMSEYKVKNKKNGFVYIVRAHDKSHAINKAIERTNYVNTYNDFTVIK